jgi:DNA-directed RNA polymerase I subunit RPA43
MVALTCHTMSMEVDELDTSIRKHKKQRSTREVDANAKKRKRSEHLDTSLASPTKKHRSKHPAQGQAITAHIPQSLDSAEASPFSQQTSSLYVPLSPICQRQPLQGLCAEHLSPLILTYYPPLNGVVLSYVNAKLSERLPQHEDKEEDLILARSIDEYAVSYVWITAKFLLFRPKRDCMIEGWINLQNEGNLGLVCWNYFNASIERKRLPKEWRWVPGGIGHRSKSQKLKRPVTDSSMETDDGEDTMNVNDAGDEEGHFVDRDGKKVEGMITFRVQDMETSRSADREQGFLSIQGTTLSEGEEHELRKQEFLRLQGKTMKRPGVRRDLDHSMSGALVNGDSDDAMDVDRSPKKKHRMAY